ARIRALRELCPPEFVVLSGDDASARNAIAHGAQGVISVTANVAPGLMSRMIAAALAGDMARAAETDAQLAPLHEKLFVETNPIPVKWALERMGLIRGHLRLPLTPLSQRFYSAVESALVHAGAPLAEA